MKFSFTTHLMMMFLLLLGLALFASVFLGLVILAHAVFEAHGVLAGLAWWLVSMATVLAIGAHIGEMGYE